MREHDIEVPDSWKSALAIAQDINPDSRMAGGCLRDLVCGVKVKDIDIFIPQNTGKEQDLNAISKILTNKDIEHSIVDDSMYKAWAATRGQEQRLVGILDVKLHRTPPVQFIVGPFSPTNLLDTFDFTVCQIMYDGKSVTTKLSFPNDVNEKKFRLAKGFDMTDLNRSVERYARFKPRYPDWRFCK